MAMPSAHIRDLLVSKGYLFNQDPATDWNTWIGKQPSFPDRAITVYDGPGLAPNPRWLLDFPSVQVKVRGGQNDYEVAYQKAKDVQDITLGINSYTALDGDRIVLIVGIGDVAFTGWDDSSRPEFVFNLRLTIEPVKGVNSNRDPL